MQNVMKKGVVWIAAAVISLTVGAFASTTQAYAAGEIAAADVAITKDFQMPTEVTSPAIDFKFEFTPTTVNELTYVATRDGGAINEKKIGYTTSSTSTTFHHIGFVNNLFDGVTFNHAGEYVYLVTEKSESAPYVEYNVNKNAYYMHVYVQNNTNGTLSITGVGTYKAAWETVGGTSSWVEKEKIDGATPTYDTNTGVISEHGQMIFTNTYPNKTQELDIKKVVAGTYADLTKKFTFTDLTVQTPSIAPTSKTEYVGTIFNAAGTATPTTVTLKQDTVDFHKYVATDSFELGNGEYIRFYNVTGAANELPVGATYSFQETGTANYIPSGTVQTDNSVTKQAVAKIGGGSFAAGDPIVVSGTSADNKNVVGEDKVNETIITNTYKDVTPTGILIDNLPWILLVCAAGAGIVVFVVSRRNKKVHVA